MTNFTDVTMSANSIFEVAGAAGTLRKLIIQYSYYDNETAGEQFITFMVSHRSLITNWAERKIIQ